MRFLGIDLAWSTGYSGVCYLDWDGTALVLRDLQRYQGIPAVLAWVDDHVPAGTAAMIAVDAPTLIPNSTGMRVPDRLAHQYFGRYDAGCYPANLGRPFAAQTVDFGKSLEARGFRHAPTLTPQQPGRYQIECFPHPAMVHLFQLPRILKYKKGSLSDRRSALERLRHYLTTVLPTLMPPLQCPTPLPMIPHRGVDMKAVEDRLDSLMCAYIGAYWWFWGSARNQVLGDETSGYLIVPMPVVNGDGTVNNS